MIAAQAEEKAHRRSPPTLIPSSPQEPHLSPRHGRNQLLPLVLLQSPFPPQTASNRTNQGE